MRAADPVFSVVMKPHPFIFHPPPNITTLLWNCCDEDLIEGVYIN